MGTFYTGDHPNPKARQIINTLSKVFKIKPSQFASLKVQKRQHDPFKTLVVTILSQNSTDRSAGRAFDKLEEAIGEYRRRNFQLRRFREFGMRLQWVACNGTRHQLSGNYREQFLNNTPAT